MGEANLKRAGVKVGLVGYSNPGRRITNRWAQGPRMRAKMVGEWLAEAFSALARMAKPMGKAASQATDRRKTSVRTP